MPHPAAGSFQIAGFVENLSKFFIISFILLGIFKNISAYFYAANNFLPSRQLSHPIPPAGRYRIALPREQPLAIPRRRPDACRNIACCRARRLRRKENKKCFSATKKALTEDSVRAYFLWSQLRDLNSWPADYESKHQFNNFI